ncbi:hypothetical protein JCM10212_002729 [Sporobolomyces blumeae]
MPAVARTLGDAKFRLWLHSITLVFALGTLVCSAPFLDMFDWNIGRYGSVAVILFVAGCILVLYIPVVHFYFHRKRPTSFVSSLVVEAFFLCFAAGLLLDPFVPELAISLLVFTWITFALDVILVSSAFVARSSSSCRRAGDECGLVPHAKSSRIADSESGMV